MKRLFTPILTGIILIVIVSYAFGQSLRPVQPSIPNYQASGKINDLVNTKLDVCFDFQKCYLNGREWVTIHPHAYPTDSLILDAKGMDIHQVAVFKNGKQEPLKFSYDSLLIKIKLDKLYQPTENYTVYIDYTAKPNERKGIAKNEKGLYFINPHGDEKDKPTEIWTEGEPESSSGWFPTIDKPNQKTTEEISMTVPAKFVTLSNGRLASQKNNKNGTRTDSWKMELPNAPYLFMMAAGDFKIYRDHWRNKEVNYYLEPKYAPYAKEIFGQTPEAMEFFSRTLGVDFPWNKEAEIIVRDYVSGAMENTSATVFGEGGQGTAKELADRYYESGLQHELFHQWFGDYVTTANWANLTLNESFADFGEIIWLEHKYGKDVAGEHVYNGLRGYLENKDLVTVPLVNYNYKAPHDAFSGVTYQKGGRILYMLRNYLGNEVFYKGLHQYLVTNAFKNAEAQQLRLAMEQASGLDLNWFFNQWYFGAGHPLLNISYQWDDKTKTEKVFVQQKQPGQIFRLPIAIDVYENGSEQRHKIWLSKAADTLLFAAPVKPDLVIVDAEHILVAEKTDSKTLQDYIFQYFHAPLYLDRFEALDAAEKNKGDKGAQKVIIAALNDPFSGLRTKAIRALDMDDKEINQLARPLLVSIVQNEKNNNTKGAAMVALAKLKDTQYIPLFTGQLNAASYGIQAAALFGVANADAAKGGIAAKSLEADNEGELTEVLFNVYCMAGNAENWPFIYNRYTTGTLQEQIHLSAKFTRMIERVPNPAYAQQGIALLKQIAVKYRSDGATPYILKFLEEIKTEKEKQKDTASVAAAADAIREIGKP